MSDREAAGTGRTRGSVPAFGPSVAPHVRAVDPDDWDGVFVIGDVHGCLDRLEVLLERLDAGPADLLLFVGDLVRKGPESRGVLELVQERPNMLSVRGNNEQKFLDGDATDPDVEAMLEAIRAMPVAIIFDDAMVVHGGIDPRRPLADHTVDDLLTTRSVPPGNGYDGPFWFESYQGPPRVFFGHTVLEAPIVTDWAVGLDTGCVYGGALTAFDYRTGELVSVPGVEHKSRPDRKFLELDV